MKISTIGPGCVCLFLLVAPVFSAVPRVTAATIKEANRAEAKLNATSTLIIDSKTTDYLNAMVRRLIEGDDTASAVGFRSQLFGNTAPYLFCLDNGAWYVSTGMLARLQNDSQLAVLVATELTPVVRTIQATHSRANREHAHLNAKQLTIKLRQESDQLAVDWLRRGAFDATEAPHAFERLLDTLRAENRFGQTYFARETLLKERMDAITTAIGASTPVPSRPNAESDGLTQIARKFALELAKTDVELSSNNGSFPAVIDRYEREFGANGASTCLRADHARRMMRSDGPIDDVINAYEKCATFPDAPPTALRDLGFVYRRQGDAQKARRFFAEYLRRVPSAADAPIIRETMEKL